MNKRFLFIIVALALIYSFHDSPIQASPDLFHGGGYILSVSSTAENWKGQQKVIRPKLRVFCFNVIDGDTIEIKIEGKRELLRLVGSPQTKGRSIF